MPTTSDPAARAAAPAGAADERWQVRLLGGFELDDGRQRLTRLPSRAVTALLARLALWPERAHAREELVELLWPGVALDVGRNRLRQALSTLKSLLEPPAAVPRPVLQADRLGVRAVPGALGCDVRVFEWLLQQGRPAEARTLYRGELLPGFYDEWIADERRRLAALFERCGAAGTGPAPPVAPPWRATPAPSPAPVPPDLAQASIPQYLTRAYGVDAQAGRLCAQVAAHRLVTLIGPGGSGKTRLAVELARALRAGGDTGNGPGAADDAGARPAFDLVAFVALADCRDAAQMLDALRAAFRATAGGGDAVERIVQALADRRALLVLDNFEQLDDEAASVVGVLAARLPMLHQLITSRRALELDGERVFRVDALDLPTPGAPLEHAAANPAVALFVDRARATRPDFHLGRGNVDAIVALVRALDGLPLAIELAASRVRSFAPAEMLARLLDGAVLPLLARSGPRTGHDRRHASMHTVVGWSWQQLDAPQRALLAGLTVFAGGCTAAAANAVCGDGTHDTRLLLDALAAHSLLQPGTPDDAEPRFALAVPLREFAAAQLDAAQARTLRARHRRWWLRWAASLGPTPPLRRVRQELPNIVAALGSAVADGAPAEAVQTVLALRAAFNEILLPAGGIAQLEAALAQVDDAALASLGHSFLALLCFEAGAGAAALRHAERGLALAPPGDDAVRARALHALASVRWRATRDARGLHALLDEAAMLAARCGELAVGASVDALRAFAANVAERDFARGEALHRRALALWQRSGNLHAINGGIYNLAICAFNGRRWDEALQLLDSVCATAREHEDWEQLSDALNVRGNTLAERRDWPAALQAYRECVRIAWGAMETHALAYGLWNLPRTLAHLRRPAAAGRLMSFAAHFWERRFGPLAKGDEPYLRRARRLVAVQLGRARWDALWAEGAALSLADAVRLALDDGAR